MQNSLAVLGTVAYKTVNSLRNDLSLLRDWVCSNQSEIVSIVGTQCAKLHKYRNAVHVLSEVSIFVSPFVSSYNYFQRSALYFIRSKSA